MSTSMFSWLHSFLRKILLNTKLAFLVFNLKQLNLECDSQTRRGFLHLLFPLRLGFLLSPQSHRKHSSHPEKTPAANSKGGQKVKHHEFFIPDVHDEDVPAVSHQSNRDNELELMTKAFTQHFFFSFFFGFLSFSISTDSSWIVFGSLTQCSPLTGRLKHTNNPLIGQKWGFTAGERRR